MDELLREVDAPIKVLHILPKWDVGVGGVKRFILNAAAALDPARYALRVLSVGKVEGDALGLDVEGLLDRPAGGFSLMSAAAPLRERIEGIAPDVVHIHCNNGTGLLYADVAGRAGVGMRLVHSHNSALGSGGFGKRFADAVLKKRYMGAPTTRVACSAAAGDWLFGAKPYRIVRNGIDVERFAFSKADRHVVRKALGIPEDGFAFALVGAGIPVKNASFALAVLSDIRRKGCEAHLVLVGEGPEAEMLQGEAERMGVMPYAHFVGTVGDVWRYYSAADALLMPSLYEGLPITLVEAQANGLPCLVSDGVSREADVTGLLRFMPLGDADAWGRAALGLAEAGSSRDAASASRHAGAVRAAGFSLEGLGAQLEEIYKGGAA